MMACIVEYNSKSKENSVSLGVPDKKTASENNKTAHTHSNEMMTPKLKKDRGRIPHLCERSSRKWWNPQMDSEILEKQCVECSLEQSIWYFQLALLFIMLACVSWIIYFGSKQKPDGWIGGVSWAACLIAVCIFVFVLTKRNNFYKKFSCYIAVGLTVLLMVTVFLAAYFGRIIMTGVGSFFLAAEVILLLYTVMPLPLHINFAFGIAFSIAYEILYRLGFQISTWTDIVAHLLLHLCMHLVGVQICINLQVRRRSTFWKVGQIIQSSLSVTVEAEFKKVMINSIMPPSIAESLMQKEGEDSIYTTTAKEDGKFRPLYVNRMENVSILYADIVGFTKMSTNKSAATLVYLLNDLFGRFDELCLSSGCEKISTLGDCYYCVAGCPEKREDHAKCCVEMGLGMISAIRDFCKDNDVNVDMRIGIHTGTVICGIVGMKRFKFDVWSNDVTFANQMEQWGVPGRIHISHSTRECLGDLYEVEDGRIEERAPKDVVKKGIKTFLIVKNVESETSSYSDETGSHGSEHQEVKEMNQVVIQNEYAEAALSNGVGTDNVAETKLDGNHPEAATTQQTSGPRVINRNKVGVAHENQASEKNSANRTASHRHHSSRDKDKKKGSQTEPRIRQGQILELIGLHGILPIANPGESAVRMEQDREFVSTIKDDPRMKNINNNQSLEPVSMRFKELSIEQAYRNKFRSEVENNEPISSFVSARFSFFLDLLISFIVFFLVFLASMLSFGVQVENVAWIVFFIVFFCLKLFVITVSGTYVFNLETVSDWVKQLITGFSGWISRHVVGAISLACPAGVVFSNMWCRASDSGPPIPSCTSYLIVAGVVIIHFLNFNQLSSWMRSIIASLVAFIITLLVYVNPCPDSANTGENGTKVSASLLCKEESQVYQYEFVLDVLLLMLFIFIVNKEYEVGHRLTYYSAHAAEENNKKMEVERNQIDQLLHHIIPPRVTEVMRDQKMYSQNHENVGVAFASIINFNEFYEETYAGGKECIRVLNELIGDVDEVLDLPRYADVEKIKTIGATFMIASGLNPNIAREPPDKHSHLCTLMEFCMKIQDVIYEFNENMVCFTFILRVGFNHGSVTAGVIGTTKLLYDIWGDTVNIASRMDSTGEAGKIQVSEESMNCMKDHFEFKYRGSTYVKGKGEMQTYLLVRSDDKDRPVLPNPGPTPLQFPLQES